MKHNSYANGGLQNIEFNDNGVDKSVGVVAPGNYILTPDREETIQCLTGSLEINNEQCLPGQKIIVKPGVPFAIETKETSSYICTYR
ncbi:MAG: pyrimidine/purine nucleoside phosphorylase [Candidatus Moraniibacteriota bacterium]